MTTLVELLKAALFGIVEGVTEWLPVSSTGHIILLKAICPPDISPAFYDFFEIVIQLAAIMAVIVLFFRKLNPFALSKSKEEKVATWQLWFKVVVAVLPSAVIGLLIDEPMDEFLRGTPVLGTDLNTVVVAAALVIYGIFFILLEKRKDREFRITDVSQIDYRTAIFIGMFQCLSIIPGTSRSGATILGAIALGVARPAGAEFSFFLAIPTMLGAGALKLLGFLKDGVAATSTEIAFLAVSCVVAFVVSLLVIKGLMEYVRKHSFSVFGIYRIILGVLVLGYFLIMAM